MNLQRLEEMEQACMVDAAYIYQKCKEMFNKAHNKDAHDEFAEKNP